MRRNLRNKSQGLFSLCVLGALVIALGASCGGVGGGTETGNPGPIKGPGPSGQPGFFASGIKASICNKLLKCFENDPVVRCFLDFDEITNIDTEIGLPQGEFENFGAIINAEMNGKLEVHKDFAIQCDEDIDQLECDDPLVTSAYDPQDPNNLHNLVNMLATESGSCPQALSLP